MWEIFAVPFQSLCNIGKGFDSAEDTAAAVAAAAPLRVLHSLKPVGGLPI